MITYDFVPLHDVYQEIIPNIPRHYAEMTDGDDYGIPDIDWDNYLGLSRLGRVGVVTVRDDGNLVGYSIFSIGNNPRYKTHIQAQSDGIFLEKEYRGKISLELIKKADEYLKKLGVNEVVYILSDDLVGRLLGRNGYNSKYKVWSRKYGQF